MLLTIVAIWAIVTPIAVLAVSSRAAALREARASQTAERSVPELRRETLRAGTVPACAVRPLRPRVTITRRVCPELPRGVRRRSAST